MEPCVFDGTTAVMGVRGGDAALIYARDGTQWLRQARVVPDDGAPGDRFGQSVALSGDTVLVGAPWHATNGQIHQGVVYVYRRDNAGWVLDTHLSANDSVAEDRFGSSVALLGDQALIGAVVAFTGGGSHARAYAFARSGSVWTQQQRIDVSQSGVEDRFGAAVALTADRALIGAPERNQGDNEGQGAAFAYSRIGDQWQQGVELKTGAGRAYERAGESVAISGDTLLVGTPGSDVQRGSVQVYVRNGAAWLPQARLSAPDGAAYDEFGFAVAIDGDTVLIGARTHAAQGIFASGAAYVYTRSGSTWSLQAKLVASDGEVLDYFGHAVTVQADTAVVSAYLRRAAYVFVRHGDTWTEQAKLVPVAIDDAVGFGYAVAMDGDTVLVSAAEETVFGVAGTGAVHVYLRVGENWIEQKKLYAPDGGELHIFGRSIAIDGDRIAVGSTRPNLARGGVLYVFERELGEWYERALFPVSIGSTHDIAASAALSGNTLVVGTEILNTGALDYGGDAYVFRRGSQGWYRDARLARPLDDNSGDAYFGAQAALSGDTLVIGAPGTDGHVPYGNPDIGAAYVTTVNLFDDSFE